MVRVTRSAVNPPIGSARLLEQDSRRGRAWKGETTCEQCGGPATPNDAKLREMSLDDYKVVLYRNQPDGWVAEVPAIPGCHALMPTREAALS